MGAELELLIVQEVRDPDTSKKVMQPVKQNNKTVTKQIFLHATSL